MSLYMRISCLSPFYFPHTKMKKNNKVTKLKLQKLAAVFFFNVNKYFSRSIVNRRRFILHEAPELTEIVLTVSKSCSEFNKHVYIEIYTLCSGIRATPAGGRAPYLSVFEAGKSRLGYVETARN